MADGTKQGITTGNGKGKTPILASAKENTAAVSKPVPIASESASITPAEVLALLQTDLSDLQSKGFTVAILVNGNGLVMALSHPAYKIGFADKHITLDGIQVVRE